METVYLGHNNLINLQLKADGVAFDLSDITKITATFGTTLISSEDKAAGLITWDQEGYATGEIRLNLGGQSITSDYYEVPIVVYDASHAEGIVWGIVDFKVAAEVEGS